MRCSPSLEGKAAAEGEVLEKSNTYIAEQLRRNQELVEMAEAAGEHVEEHLRMYLGGDG